LTVRESLRKYIQDELLTLADNRELLYDEDLLADEMVDSLGMIRLLSFIRDTYGYSVPPEDFLIENFQSIDIIAAYLERNLTEGQ
jgi:acyl carrier protein